MANIQCLAISMGEMHSPRDELIKHHSLNADIELYLTFHAMDRIFRVRLLMAMLVIIISSNGRYMSGHH